MAKFYAVHSVGAILALVMLSFGPIDLKRTYEGAS